MLKKTFVMAIAAGAMLVATPAFAGGNTGILNEAKVVPCLSNFNLVGVSAPIGNATECPKVGAGSTRHGS